MLFASATPLVRGATTRYRQLGVEIGPHLEEYESLNAQYQVSRHSYWISHPKIGPDIGVSVYDIGADGLASMRGRVWDKGSAHDRWWIGFVQDVNGFDLSDESAHTGPPEQVWSWSR